MKVLVGLTPTRERPPDHTPASGENSSDVCIYSDSDTSTLSVWQLTYGGTVSSADMQKI